MLSPDIQIKQIQIPGVNEKEEAIKVITMTRDGNIIMGVFDEVNEKDSKLIMLNNYYSLI